MSEKKEKLQGGEKMQQQKTRTGVRCPNCNQFMQGYSISFHNYNCSNCGTEIRGLGITANQGLEVIGAICLVGLLVLFISALD